MISRFSIARQGQLTLLESTTLKAIEGVGPVNAGLPLDGRWLLVDESAVGAPPLAGTAPAAPPKGRKRIARSREQRREAALPRAGAALMLDGV
jgi:hypothetical protein